jgi:hypothetical protein
MWVKLAWPMLKAFFSRKLRWSVALDEAGTEAPAPGGGEPPRIEDSLTSAVFERFAYLEPRDAWATLREASSLLHGAELPAQVPDGTPTWLFWRKLLVGERGRNAHHVEPDVLVIWNDTVLLIEAKHRSVQMPAQWVEEIRAVRGSYADKKLWMVAVGGLALGAESRLAADAWKELGAETPSILGIRWENLCAAAHARQLRAVSPGAAACFGDIAAALDAWGYRRRLGFDTLPAAAGALRGSATPVDIPRYAAAALDTRGYRRQLGFDTLPAVAEALRVSATPVDIPRLKGR